MYSFRISRNYGVKNRNYRVGFAPDRRFAEESHAAGKGFLALLKMTAGDFLDVYIFNRNQLAHIQGIIEDLERKVEERVWTHKPQECEGTYSFLGKPYITRGIQEELTSGEIN